MLKTLNALSEPTRLQIVEYLQAGPRSVGEIATELHLPQPQVSKHLRVLVEAQLVEVQPVAQRRIYQLRPQPFQELDDWLVPFRRSWEERFDRLEQYLHELQATAKKADDLQP